MFEEFYEMYEPEEQEVVALINRCIGGGYNWKGKHRLTRAHREKQLKMSCQALHNAPPNRT